MTLEEYPSSEDPVNTEHDQVFFIFFKRMNKRNRISFGEQFEIQIILSIN